MRKYDYNQNLDVLTKAAGDIIYCMKQTAKGAHQWRINASVRSTIEDLQHYLEGNPEEGTK